MTEAASDTRPQYRVYAILALGATGAAGMLSLARDPSFQPYFGRVPPLLVFAGATLLGFISLRFLHATGGFELYARRKYLRGVVLAAKLATLFAVPVILVDVGAGFPRDINVPPPQSLLFYPAIAFVAEVAFHALPLAILLLLLGRLAGSLNSHTLVWLCILLASLAEPAFQLSLASSAGPLSGIDVYVGVHVFALNMVQLYIFRRYDFVSMYAFRLVYYVHWHIAWGYARLSLLF